MHSKDFQHNNPEIYQHFFSHHDLVISLPRSFLLCGHSKKYTGGGSSLGAKIPQKIYLGAKFRNKVNPYIHYIYPKNEKFKNSEIKDFYNIDSSLLKELGIDFEVNILAEHNFFEIEYILSLLILAKAIYKQEITSEYLKKTTISKSKEILMYLDRFKKKQKKQLLFINQNKKIDFNKIAISIVHSDKIILVEKNYNCKEIQTQTNRNNLFNYHLINQHLPFQLQSIENPLQKSKNKQKTLAEMLIKIEKYFSYKMIESLQNGKESCKKLFESIESYHKIMTTIIGNQNIDIIKKEECKTLIKKHLDFTTQAKDLCIFTDKNMHIFGKRYLSITKENIEKINHKKSTKFSLDYTSKKDGIQKKGLCIEQEKNKKQYSQFCSDYEIKTIKNSRLIHQSMDYHTALLQKKDGILFDAVENKIFIMGEKLCSKQIHSQTGTVELFKNILQERGNEISNHILPRSCYSQNKNEMLGKIILPLKRIVENKTGKLLPISCYGSLGHFYIKMGAANIPIYFLERRI